MNLSRRTHTHTPPPLFCCPSNDQTRLRSKRHPRALPEPASVASRAFAGDDVAEGTDAERRKSVLPPRSVWTGQVCGWGQRERHRPTLAKGPRTSRAKALPRLFERLLPNARLCADLWAHPADLSRDPGAEPPPPPRAPP